MTRELIIEGQHVDLAPNTDITLEFVNNIIGDIGKINLSRSYTVKIPKTIRNTRILDDPGRPGHESGVTRRFLNARYYRNGIDLIGDVRAYLLHTTEDAYEVALVWNNMESLEKLSQTKETINDLPDLPVIRWIGTSGTTPDYTGGDNIDGAIHAWYNSGLGLNRTPYQINAATHPSMKISGLFDRIMSNAGVTYQIHSAAAKSAMQNQVILAAPSRKLSAQMDAESGTRYDYAFTETDTGDKTLRTDNEYRTDGWDPVVDQYYNVKIGDETKHRVLINIKVPTENLADFAGVDLIIQGHDKEGYDPNGTELARITLKDGAYYFDEELEVSGFGTYYEIFSTRDIPSVVFTAYKPGQPLLRYYKPHEEIRIDKDNRFPIEGNLPDIGKWDFVKACFAFYGLVPIIRNEVLHLYSYNDILDLSNAYDWSAKVDQTTDGMPRDISYAIDDWAQRNNITFEENPDLPFNPNVRIDTEDGTLKESRDWFELPFAASQGNTAAHYKKNKDGAYESADLTPRIFEITLGLQGITLGFGKSMYGEGLKAAFYERVQSVMRRPVVMTLNIRLHEIDLAQLDLSRPVYLKQYGKYYAVTKIQTSDTDLCKVELLQLP